MLFGDADCRSCILVVLVTATAVATTALVETLKTQHVVNDGVQNAPHVWNTQLRIDTRLVSELAATKNTLLWEMGWENRYRAYTSQQQLVCHWNVTHYCVTPLKYNDYTYLGFGKKKKKSPPRSLEQCVTRHRPSPGTGYYYQSSPPSGHPSLRNSD